MTARFLSGRGRRAEGFRYRGLRCEDAMMATARPEKVTLRSTDRRKLKSVGCDDEIVAERGLTPRVL